MTPTELYKAGKLQEAIDAQIADVKSHPGDQVKRMFLFELLMFSGEIERAEKQIDMIKYEEMELATAVAQYRKLIDAEKARRQYFKDGVLPRFFGEQPEHVHFRLTAVKAIRNNELEEANALLQEAAKAMPALKGKYNEKPFESFRDCDDLFSGVLEVMGQGGYFWVPMDQIETLQVTAPKFPRDLIWRPGRLELNEGTAGNIFLPTLYPGSYEHADPQVKLGRMTDWKAKDNAPVFGVGTHLYLIGDDDASIMEWKTLEFE